MKLRKLEIALEKIEGFETPNINYEQYKTPAIIAAPLLHMAYMNGEIEGKTVYDLGCGTGILSIGAVLLGAKEVIGFDIDENAISAAEKNMQKMTDEMEEAEISSNLRFIVSDVSEIPKMMASHLLKKADTIIMNPPFGAQEKGNDRPFLTAAIEAGEIIYSVHNKGSRPFIEKYIKPAVVTNCFITNFPIRKTYDFHKKESHSIAVEIYRIETGRKS